ncbi:MAG TPA: hypothetical protein VGG35_17340 [Streptosporangiaceae bacterium]|jgi:hypothetical protein
MPEETPTELIRRLMPLCATLGIRTGDGQLAARTIQNQAVLTGPAS